MFIKYNEHSQTIEIKPQDKSDKGLHIILVEFQIKSSKNFHALEILVKLPVSYIDSNLKPIFYPALKDEAKQYYKIWQEHLE